MVQFTLMPSSPVFGDRDLDGLTRLIRSPIAGPFYRLRFKMVLDILPADPGDVLEIGYGAGFLTYVLARGARSYTGIDLHPYADAVGKNLSDLGLSSVRLARDNALDLATVPDRSVDTVVSVSCLEHIRDQEQVQRQVLRVLRPGGIAVYGLPVKNLLTSAIFRVLGYDHNAIHPSAPPDVAAAAPAAGLMPERERFFPIGCGNILGLYWVAGYRAPL